MDRAVTAAAATPALGNPGSQVSQDASDLVTALDRVNDRVTALVDRLQSVSVKQGSPDSEKDPSPAPVRSPMAEFLHSQAGKAYLEADRLAALLESLDL